MTGTQTLLARTTLGVAASFFSILLTGWGRLRQLPCRTFDRRLVAAFALSRAGLFVLIFLVLHLVPRGDIPAFYFPQAVEVLHGHLPYRDFPSSYAPLHAYLDAVAVVIWHTPQAIIFAAVLFELLLVPLWLRIGRRFFEENVVRAASLLYLASPISLQFVTVDGQDNVLIALLIALALLAVLCSRNFLSGALIGLAASLVKFLPLLFIPAFLLTLPRRRRWAAGATLVLAAIYGGACLLHLPILQPVAAEGEMRSAGNLPYLVEALGGFTIPGAVSNLLLLAVLAAIFAVAAYAAHRASTVRRMRILTFSMSALTLALLLFSKKSWPPYLMLCLFPVCLLAAGEEDRSRWRVRLFAAFGVIAVTEQSVWSSLLLEAPSLKFRQALLTGNPVAQAFLVVHLLLLAGYVWLLYEALRQMIADPLTTKARAELAA